MTDSVLQFYQRLASQYHLIFADWAKSIERQGNALDRLLRTQFEEPPLRVLDCSCGIGTQALGLAERGYAVHATDLSPAAVERAAQEAAKMGIPLTVGVADFRSLEQQVEGTFDVVLSCDNSLPHLITDADLLLAAKNMRAKLNKPGLLVISIRDYDDLTLDKPDAITPHVYHDPDGRRIVFQVWEWSEDGHTYTTTLFIVKESGGGWQTTAYETTYRALLRDDLNAILQEAGFTDIRWHMPQDTGYYQPIVTARPPEE